jgi:methylenetetrahydrofolate--tRNA-(uracil-5-)-methyltransferase
MLGALCGYVSAADPSGYQPTNASFGLLPEAPATVRRKKDRREARAARAIRSMESWSASLGLQAAGGAAS